MLADVHPATAPARVRAWGEVVEAGAEAWRAIPALGPDRRGVDGDIDTLHDVAVGVHQLLLSRGGPVLGRRTRTPNSWWRACPRPVTWSGPGTAPPTRSSRRRSGIWRRRGCGSCTRSLRRRTRLRRSLEQYERALASGRDRARLPAPLGEAALVRELIRRVDAAEGLARGYLDLRWPATARGERLDPAQPTRLETAVAEWQLQAARALTASPSVADVALVVRTQLDGAVFAWAVGGAATHAGLLIPHEGVRMQHALTAFEGSAGALMKSLSLLGGRDRTFQARLAEASSQLRVAYRDIARDGPALTDCDTLRERVDIARALAAVQHSLVAGVDLSWRILDAARDPHLMVRAQGAHQIASQSYQPRPSQGWVEAIDLVHNRLIGTPSPVRYTLRHQAQDMTDRAIDSAAASYSSQTRPPTAPSAPRLSGRTHQDRQPPTLGPESPGPSLSR